MAGTENLEQELLGDIIKIRSTLETSWGDIQANATTISAILNHLLTKLEGLTANEVKNDFEEVKTKVESTLSDLTLDYLESSLAEMEQNFSETIDPLLDEVDGFGADMIEIFDKVMSQVSDLGGLPGDIQRAIEPMENIVKAILGNDFSVKLKDLPDHQSSDGAGSSEKKQAAEAGVSLFESLSSQIETAINDLETLSNSNPFKQLESSIKTLAKAQLKGLEGNVIATLAALVADLEGHGPGPKIPLSLQLIIDNLESLLEAEKTQVTTTITDLYNEVETAFTAFQTIIQKFSAIKLDPESELYELFSLILPDIPNPGITDLISLVISIPLTLTLESTGRNPIIANPYKKAKGPLSFLEGENDDSVLSGEAILIITGCLQLTSVYFAVCDKFVDYYYEDKGSATPYQWKLFKTFFSTGCTATTLAVNIPTASNAFSKPTTQGWVWISQWFTSVGFGLVKGLTDADQTRKLADLKVGTDFQSNLQVVQTEFKLFYSVFANWVTLQNPSYRSLISEVEEVSPSFSPILTDMRAASIYKTLYNMNKQCQNIKNEAQLKSMIDRISSLSIPEFYSETLVQGLQDEAFKFRKKRTQQSENVYNNVYKFIDELNEVQTTFDDPLSKFKSKVSGLILSDKYNTQEKTKNKVLNRNFAAAGLLLQIYNTTANSYVFKQLHPSDYANFSLNLGIAVPDIIDSISGLAWYIAASKTPLTDTQKKVKKYMGYGTFFIGKASTIASAVFKFVKAGEGAQIQSAIYDTRTPKNLTVTFNNKVSLVSGKTTKECFVLSDGTNTLQSATPPGSADTYVLTFTDDLSTSDTISVKSNSLKNPAGDSITQNVPSKITQV